MCFSAEITVGRQVYACFDQDDARRFETFDGDFLWFFESDAPEHIAIPAVISGELLCRCGYFSAFPDQIMALAALGEDHLGDVADSNRVRADQFRPMAQYLTPAACLHFYPMLAQRNLPPAMALTTRARVFRRETRTGPALTRLWDFTVREFVFVGSVEHVKARLEHAHEAALDYASGLFSDVSLEIASDHFYPTAMNRAKARMQRGNSRKVELVARFGDLTVALASFNFHDLHFSGAFGFDDARRVVTGCAGFGLERWIGALALERGAAA